MNATLSLRPKPEEEELKLKIERTSSRSLTTPLDSHDGLKMRRPRLGGQGLRANRAEKAIDTFYVHPERVGCNRINAESKTVSFRLLSKSAFKKHRQSSNSGPTAVPGPTPTPGSKYSKTAPDRSKETSVGSPRTSLTKISLSSLSETLETAAVNRPPAEMPSLRVATTSKGLDSSFHPSKSRKASLVEIFMSLLLTEDCGLRIAALLAAKFRWTLPQPLSELLANWNGHGKSYTSQSPKHKPPLSSRASSKKRSPAR